MNLELLRQYGKLRTYNMDGVICAEGEQGCTAFLLLDGYARVTHGSAMNAAVVVATLSPGVLFGEMSLLEDKPRIASVIADRAETVVLEIGKDDFLGLIKAEPDIGYGLMVTLLGRVDKTLDMMNITKIGFVSEVRRNKHYQLLQRLSKEQFVGIIEKDPDHALTLLKYLSHTLAEVDRNIS